MKKALPLKFGIGFIAGLCAAIFPRLIAGLTTSKESDVVMLFSQNYVLLSLLFAVLVGVVIMILEWEASRIPKDIFMSALAIPGILSGALNTTASVKDFEEVEKEKFAYQQIVDGIIDVEVQELDSGELLAPVGVSTIDIPRSPAFDFSLISQAYAAGGVTLARDRSYGIGIGRKEKLFLVVLAQADSEQQAKKKASELRENLAVNILRSRDNRFFITTQTPPQSKVKAYAEIFKLNKEYFGLNATLLTTR